MHLKINFVKLVELCRQRAWNLRAEIYPVLVVRSVCTLWIIDINTLVMSFGSTDSRHKTSRSLAVRDEHNARQYSRFFMAP